MALCIKIHLSHDIRRTKHSVSNFVLQYLKFVTLKIQQIKQVSACRNSVVTCGLQVLEDGTWRQQVFTPSQRTVFPELKWD